MIRNSLLALCVFACELSAQTSRRSFCFQEGDTRRCKNNLITELSIGSGMNTSYTNRFEGVVTPSPIADFDAWRVNWAIGLGRNLSPRNAIGAAVVIDKTRRPWGGAELRYRRWFIAPPPRDSARPPFLDVFVGYSQSGVTRIFQCTGPPGQQVCNNQPGDDLRVTGSGVRFGISGSIGPVGLFARAEVLRAQSKNRNGLYVGVTGYGIGAVLGSLAVLTASALQQENP